VLGKLAGKVMVGGLGREDAKYVFSPSHLELFLFSFFKPWRDPTSSIPPTHYCNILLSRIYICSLTYPIAGVVDNVDTFVMCSEKCVQ